MNSESDVDLEFSRSARQTSWQVGCHGRSATGLVF